MYIPVRPPTLGLTDNDADPLMNVVYYDPFGNPLQMVTVDNSSAQPVNMYYAAGSDPSTAKPLTQLFDPVTTLPVAPPPLVPDVQANVRVMYSNDQVAQTYEAPAVSYAPAPAPISYFDTSPPPPANPSGPPPASAPAVVVTSPDGVVTPAPVLVAPIMIQPSGPGVTIPATMPGDYTGDFEGTPIPADDGSASKKSNSKLLLGALAALLAFNN